MPESQTQTTHCRVLDVVKITGVEGVTEGDRGVITQVRRYPDGAYKYSVAVGDDGLIVDSDNVVPSGDADPVEKYFPPGSLFPWDELEIRQGTVKGVIDGW